MCSPSLSYRVSLTVLVVDTNLITVAVSADYPRMAARRAQGLKFSAELPEAFRMDVQTH